MSRAYLVKLLALVAAGALVYGAALRIPAINAGRQQLNLIGSESPLKNTPPEYVFYIQAFGAFRGLIGDVAFIRAEKLKEQGRFFDAHQLHRWICDLQPYFPAVWEYCAWNMAWNISVATFTPQERWNWVYNGIKLLRDEGIPRNPRAVNLYKQLAWTFNNKMSEATDDQHYAYKANWAWRMHLALGPPPDPLADLEATRLADQLKTTADIDKLAEVGRRARALEELDRQKKAAEYGEQYEPLRQRPAADEKTAAAPSAASEVTPFRIAQRAAEQRLQDVLAAPLTLAELYGQQPAARDMVARLRGLGISVSDDTLTEDDYWRDEGLAFALLKPYRELTTTRTLLTKLARTPAQSYQQDARRENIAEILGVRGGDPAGRALVHFVERKVLAEVYQLDPAHMLDVVQTFGPVDWRAVDAQALYWLTRGLLRAPEGQSKYGSDKMNTARIIFFSLRNLFLRNRIIFEPNPAQPHQSYLNLSRDLNFIGPLNDAYLKYGPLFDPTDREQRGAGSAFRSGHINLLTEAIRLLYLSGREPEAEHYFESLRENYATTPDGTPNPALTKSLHDFVMDSFLESLAAPGVRDIMIVIDGWLNNAYAQLAAGDTEGYVRLVQAAQEYHENYMVKKRDDPTVGRQKIPEFLDLQIDAFGNWLASPATSPLRSLDKVRLWGVAPLYLRQAVYDDLRPLFESECNLWDFDLNQAFPEPPGMDVYRQQHPERTAPGAPADAPST